MIKVILVPLDGSDQSSEVLDTALVVAKRFDAHIKAVHVRQQAGEPFMFGDIGSSFREEYKQLGMKAMNAVVSTVKQQFTSFCERNKVKITKKVTRSVEVSASLHILDGDPLNRLEEEARLVDVVALSRPHKHRLGGLGVGELHESLMMHSGRPVLIVPPDWNAKKADHAAIGWNDSVEASRALALTLPWLVQMKKVTVIVSKARADNVDSVLDYLKRHGCKVDHHVISNGGNVGKKMQEACNEVGAQFLVVGGFSHTRTRQRLFGGVTSHLLANTDIITVMAH